MSLRMLIVEDEAEMLEGLSGFFTAMGHSVFGARLGNEALDILAKETLDVALCDLHLKESPVTGLDVIKKISQDHSSTKIIIMTGFGGDKEIYDACMKFKPYMYLDKPLDLIKIQNALLEIEKNKAP